MKKYQVILLGLIILLIVIGIWNRYQPIMINKTIETSIYRMDQSQYELPLKITMKGKYYRRIFKEDFFEGKVTLNQYDFTRIWDTLPIHIDEEGDLLQYITFDENEFINSYSQDTAIFVAYLSHNREEAIELLKKYY